MRVAIVVPAYNEELRIKEVIERLLTRFVDVIVVNDGSKDKTGEVVKSFPVYYCEHAINLGQGAGLKTGTELAIALGAEIIVHADADGQHRVEDIEKIVAALDETGSEVVIGSRFLSVESDIPVKKRVILRLANLFLRIVLRIKVSDPQNGLRAFRAHAWPKIKFSYDDFRHCTEILFLTKRNNVKLVESPVKINYDAYSRSKTNRPSVKMGAQILIDKLIR